MKDKGILLNLESAKGVEYLILYSTCLVDNTLLRSVIIDRQFTHSKSISALAHIQI